VAAFQNEILRVRYRATCECKGSSQGDGESGAADGGWLKRHEEAFLEV